MNRNRSRIIVTILFYTLLTPAVGLSQQVSTTNPPVGALSDPIDRIKEEEQKNSHVMKILEYLADSIGPRLTASPAMMRANEWARDQLAGWGLQNSHLEPWGPFGRGWTLKRFSAQVVEPLAMPIIAYPKAWSPGTNGTVTGEVIILDAKDEVDLERFRGKLRGAIVLMNPPRQLKANYEPLAQRLSDKDLHEFADAPDPATEPFVNLYQLSASQRANAMLAAKKLQFVTSEGAAVLIEGSFLGDGGTLLVQQATVPQPFLENPFDRRRIQPWEQRAPKYLPQIVVASEHYNRMVRMLKRGEKLRLSIDLDVEFKDHDLMSYNTVAEIPGTDLKDELVMLGGHMDSWHAGTGATDNGSGVAVAMEAVRILQALKLRPRRTIRIALWSGEEQRILGSQAYVADHFGVVGDGSSETLMSALFYRATPAVRLKPDSDKLSAYYNLDGGTGRIRGVYLQGNEALRPIFRQWLKPFSDMGATTLTIANAEGTDHQSFDAIGLPGFEFIQDNIEYETRTHHTNQDVFERAQADDLKQAAIIMAAFVYNTAMLDQKLTRKSITTSHR